jgi:hypothetical protein
MLVPEELRLRPALLSPGSRVTIVGVIGNRLVLGRFAQIGGEPGGIDPLALVVNEVLQMIGVPALFASDSTITALLMKMRPLAAEAGTAILGTSWRTQISCT